MLSQFIRIATLNPQNNLCSNQIYITEEEYRLEQSHGTSPNHLHVTHNIYIQILLHI